MTKTSISFSSPAFYSLLGAIAVQILTFVLPSLSGTTASIVSLILMILGTYLHPAEIQNAGRTGMIGSTRI